MTVYGISILAVIPVRATPSDKAEMLTQLLFGETYKVLEKKKKWHLIQGDYDGYEGWIDATQSTLISKSAWDSYNKTPHYYLSKPVKAIKTNENN
ncbi:MAG: SH3 domain-containing protein, partial [Bacteroidales bacterium]|nr:SH3 domain-containing protein [Bacteroidales bacterium]